MRRGRRCRNPSPPARNCRGRLTPPENWHLTLKFLGPTPIAQRDAVAEHLRSLAVHPPFDLQVAGFGGFPRTRTARVLWFGVGAGADALAALARDADDLTHGLDFPREARPYHAHLTLARSRSPVDARPLAAALSRPVCTMTVDQVVLFASIPTGRGARYEPRASIALRSAS